jgi:hypothetical protein
LGFGNIPEVITCQQDLNALRWVVLVIQFLVTGSLGVAHFLDYGARKESHKVAESGFETLFYNIKTQLSMDRRNRQYGEDYAEWIQNQYTQLSANPDIPAIPGNVYKKYLDKVKGTAIANIDDLEEIEIYEDPPGLLFSTVTPREVDNDIEKMNNFKEEYNKGVASIDIIQDKDVEELNSEGSPRMKITIPREQYISGIDSWHLKRFFNNE